MFRFVFIRKTAFAHSLNARVAKQRRRNKCYNLDLVSHDVRTPTMFASTATRIDPRPPAAALYLSADSRFPRCTDFCKKRDPRLAKVTQETLRRRGNTSGTPGPPGRLITSPAQRRENSSSSVKEGRE
ncbi:hypothetical protein EYF80_009212 [Liparis tanakae]|uniref:Uncharacterized protein n=1 Tax=Liparis tanakae TaxID=230148 RepID=A0A4Z2ITF4_9TELE|nr:hypothetical protein EYF80_009212 [Liparis tanakae]